MQNLLSNKLTYKLHKRMNSLTMAKNWGRNMSEQYLIKTLCKKLVLNIINVA